MRSRAMLPARLIMMLRVILVATGVLRSGITVTADATSVEGTGAIDADAGGGSPTATGLEPELRFSPTPTPTPSQPVTPAESDEGDVDDENAGGGNPTGLEPEIRLPDPPTPSAPVPADGGVVVVGAPEDYNTDPEEIDVADGSDGSVTYDAPYMYTYDDLASLGRLGGDSGAQPPQPQPRPQPQPLEGTPDASDDVIFLGPVRGPIEVFESYAPGPLLEPLPGPYDY